MTEPHSPRDFWSSLLVVVTMCIGALPLIIGEPAALQDWPNHVARVAILDGMLHGNGFWLEHYHLNPWLVTNVVLDYGIDAIHHMGISIARSATIFLLLTYVCFVLGFTFLAESFPGARRDPLKPLLAIVIFFTAPLLFGLVNYVLGLGIAFWGWALWLRCQGSIFRQCAIGITAVVIICVCHVAAACAFVLVLFCLHLAEAPRNHLIRAALHPTVVLPGIVLLGLIAQVAVLSHEGGDGAHSAIIYERGSTLLSFVVGQVYLLVHVLVDAIGVSGLKVTIIGFGMFVLLAIFGASVRLPRAPAIAACVTLFVALALPSKIGLAGRVAYRVALVPVVMVGAGAQFRWRKPRLQAVSLSVLAGLVVARSGVLVHTALQSNATYRAFEADAAVMPPGSMLITALGRPFEQIPWSEYWSPPLEELGTAAVAHSVFVTSIFAFKSQQPIVLDKKYDVLGRPSPIEGSAGFTQLLQTLRPFCNETSAGAHKPTIFLLIVYPGQFIDATIDAQAVLARGAGYRLVNACELLPRAQPA